MARIKYGISDAYYAVVTSESLGVLTYDTPKALKGAVSVTLTPSSEQVTEYADNGVWFQQMTNFGYTGSLELETIPDDFREDVLLESADTKDVLWEADNVTPKEFALFFKFEIGGDSTSTGKKVCLLRCTAARPDMAGSTKTNTITPEHETINITAVPRLSDHLVKATCESSSAAYATWTNAVPTVSTN